ncbi:uncharacterized protein LOC122506079 [Leptopilina heterotoma]|uniref:uncharacterized protein LOC122506079 n=1 Tax=Leptopilina heterotoma TaxID=63436 RepID=UPI001CA835AB|nr:uncharacterized protein LOC122506079 [Leptopilina heterotoma]
MFRIAIICLVLSLFKSGKCELNETSLQLLKTSFFEAIDYVRKEVRDEDAAICIGIARAGKSTLINYLIGVPLAAKILTKHDHPRLIVINDTDKSPKIGHGSVSTTSKPSRWVSSKLSNLAIWDTPGFNDNRGEVQDIINAFYLFQLLKHIKSLKIILVAKLSDIRETNIRSFTDLLENLCTLLGNEMVNLFGSISLIFTQYDPSEHNISNLEEHKVLAKHLFHEKILSKPKLAMRTDSRSLVKYLFENIDHVGFFNAATKEGTDISELDVGIFSAIRASGSIPKSSLQSLHPSISDTSEISLRNSLQRLTSLEQVTNLSVILQYDISYQKTVADNLALNNNKTEIKTFIERFKIFQKELYECMQFECNLTTMINITQSYSSKLADEIKKTNFTERIVLLEFLDYLLKSVRVKEYTITFKTIIWSTIYQIRNLINHSEEKLLNVTRTLYAEDEVREKKKFTEEIKRLVRELRELKEKNPNENSLIDITFKALEGIYRTIMNIVNQSEMKEIYYGDPSINNIDSETSVTDFHPYSPSQTFTTTIPDDDLC